MYPSTQQFSLDLTTLYYVANSPPKVLHKDLLTQIVSVFSDLYVEDFRPALRPNTAYQLLLRTCVEALQNFTDKIHSACLEQPPNNSLFSTAHLLSEFIIQHIPGKTSTKYAWAFCPGQHEAYQALAEPFKRARKDFESLHIFSWNVVFPSDYVLSPREPDSDDKEDKRRYEKRMKEYDKDVQAAWDEATAYALAVAGTPLYRHAYRLLPHSQITIPFEIPREKRFAGTWIVAPPGRGKTTLLSSMFFEDLKLVAANKASIIVMDSKGEFIDKLKHLQVFAPGQPLYGRLTLIEPDPDYPLALNPLDLSEGSTAHLSLGQRKMLANRSVTLLEYLFETLLEAKMTPLQSRFFRAVLRAMIEVIPNPTLFTFQDIVENGYERYEEYISRLDDRSFFSKEQFYGSTYKDTKAQIIWRVGLLLDNYAIASMFKSPTTKLNLAKEMDGAKVIIINNSKALLEDNGAEFFGRFFLYLMRKAAERRSLQGNVKMPVYCYIDEAHNVIRRDVNVATIVQECRSQNIAMIFAHQAMSQIDETKVIGALADCAIIFANSFDEAAQLAPRLHAETPEFLNQPVGTFAAYVRDTANRPVVLKVPLPPAMPLMTKSEQEQIRREMRAKYCAGEEAPPSQPDDQCDLHWDITIPPRVAEQGGERNVADTLTVCVPPGTKDGTVLRVSGKGSPRLDGTYGDLYLHVSVPLRPGQRSIGSGETGLEEWG